MLEKVKEFQVYASAVVVLIGAGFYVFQIISSVQTTAAEYKTLKGEFHQYRTEQRLQEFRRQDRRHQLDLRLKKLEVILELLDKRVAPVK